MELSKIPGFKTAERRGIELEDRLRGSAFSGLNETICGIEVRPLTLRILRRLRAARNPFVEGSSAIRPGHIAAFLWAISPGYSFKTKRAREKAKAKLVERASKLSYRQSRRGIGRYLWYATMDRPPTRRKKSSQKSLVSFEAAMIHRLASVYGWDDEAILDKPLRRLYQYLQLIRTDADPKAHTFNPIVSRLTRIAIRNANRKSSD